MTTILPILFLWFAVSITTHLLPRKSFYFFLLSINHSKAPSLWEVRAKWFDRRPLFRGDLSVKNLPWEFQLFSLTCAYKFTESILKILNRLVKTFSHYGWTLCILIRIDDIVLARCQGSYSWIFTRWKLVFTHKARFYEKFCCFHKFY